MEAWIKGTGGWGAVLLGLREKGAGVRTLREDGAQARLLGVREKELGAGTPGLEGIRYWGSKDGRPEDYVDPGSRVPSSQELGLNHSQAPKPSEGDLLMANSASHHCPREACMVIPCPQGPC